MIEIRMHHAQIAESHVCHEWRVVICSCKYTLKYSPFVRGAFMRGADGYGLACHWMENWADRLQLDLGEVS